jgi:RNA polymerase sigma-B factor
MNTIFPERDHAIQAHRAHGRRIARRFMRPGLDLEDLEQIAMVGLIKAADAFRASHGVNFWDFARTHVLGELMHYTRDHEAVVRLPRSMYVLQRREMSVHGRLLVELGREPNIAEIALAIGCAEDDLHALHCAKYRCNVAELEQIAEPISPAHRVDERAVIAASLRRLEPDEHDLLLGVYGLRLTQAEVGRRLGYTQRSASRLHRRALHKLSLALGEF